MTIRSILEECDEAERIAVANGVFDAMSPAQQRVQIAKDVLERLDAQSLVAQRRKFLDWVPIDAEPKADDQLRDVFSGKECTACAVGALFMCALTRHDKLTVRQAGAFVGGAGLALSSIAIVAYLKNFFSMDQIRLMERAFELGDGYFRAENPDDYRAGDLFVNHEFNSEKRLRLIMENVIVNNGTFVV